MREKKTDTNRKSRFLNVWKYIFCPLVLAAVHILLVWRRDRVTFHWPEEPQAYMYGILALFVLFTYGFYLLIVRSVILLHRRDERFFSYFRYFLGYFLFMCIFWVLTWPGIFKGDEFYTIRGALDFQLSGAQSGLTSIFYIVSLLFFPSMAGIVFVQLFLICIIFSVVCHDFIRRCGTKLRYLFYLPFLFLPVIDGNLFTLRSTLVGWCFLLLLDRLSEFAKRQCPENGEGAEKEKAGSSLHTYLQLTGIAALCGLICAWRSEFIYLLVCVPVFLLWSRKAGWKETAVFLLAMLLLWRGFCIPNNIALAGQNKYPISLVLNPLANMFTEEDKIQGPSVYEDVMTINELVDVKRLRLDATAGNISQYWNIPDILPKEQLQRFMQASLRLIVYNPDLYLKYRWKTFLMTNGFVDRVVNHPGGEDPDAILNLNYYGTDYRSYFACMQPPLGQKLREKAIGFLACRKYDRDSVKNSIFLPFCYNVMPVLILLSAALICQLLRKKKDESLLILLVLMQFPLIFLTAPAMFFMYYFCLYLCGWVMIVETIVSLAGGKEKK